MEFLFLAQWASWRNHSSHWLPTEERHKHTHTHTHHNATALQRLLSAVPHLHVCVARLLPSLPNPSNATTRTVGCNRWMPAKQMTPATEHTSVCPKWRHSTANLRTFRPKCQCWKRYLQFYLIWPLDALCWTGCAERWQAVTGLSVFTNKKTNKCVWKYMKLLRYNLPYIGLVFFVIHPSKKKHPPWRWPQKVTKHVGGLQRL